MPSPPRPVCIFCTSLRSSFTLTPSLYHPQGRRSITADPEISCLRFRLSAAVIAAVPRTGRRLADPHVILPRQISQGVDLILRQVRPVGDPDGPVIHGVDRGLVLDRGAVEAAVQPVGGMFPVGRRVLVVGYRTLDVPVGGRRERLYPFGRVLQRRLGWIFFPTRGRHCRVLVLADRCLRRGERDLLRGLPGRSPAGGLLRRLRLHATPVRTTATG